MGQIAELGILLSDKRDYPAFRLPCPCHIDRRCTVYGRRPSACGSYQCDLLKSGIAGDRTYEECHRIVDQARAVMGRIYSRIGERDPAMRIWEQAQAFLRAHTPRGMSAEEARQTHGPLLLDLNVLGLLCGRYFQPSNFQSAWRWEDVTQPRPLSQTADA